jgi:predicted permease
MLLSFGLILFPLFLGLSLQRRLAPWAKPLQKWVIFLALPSLVFEKLSRLDGLRFDTLEFWLLIAQPWTHFFVASIAVVLLGHAFRWSRSITGALALTVALGNTSFVGIPLIRMLQGEHAVAHAVLLDQLGSFLILATVAVPLATALSPLRQGRVTLAEVLKRVLTFPSFLALVAAFFLRSTEALLPEWVFSMILGPLGWTLAPTALLWVGINTQLAALKTPALRKPLALGLALKLILFPALTYAVLRLPLWSTVPHETLRTVMLESAMGSMITAGVVAVDRGYDSQLAPLMVAVSVLLSLVSVPLWNLLY